MRAAGDMGGRRDRRRSLRLSSQETAQGTFLSLFILSFFWRSLMFSALETFQLAA